jgi:hemerythrin HHE cation binding domain-containing protein
MTTGVELLRAQHRTIGRLIRELLSDGYRRNRLLLRLIGDLSAHVAVEVNVLYPGVRRALGARRVRLNLDHEIVVLRRVKELLMGLATNPKGGDFQGRTEELLRLFDEHVVTQETSFFPECALALDDATLEDIMSDVETVSFGLMAKARPFVRTPTGVYGESAA